MELTGKNVRIHLSTPLVSTDAHGSISTIKGKVIEKLADGFYIQIESFEPKREGKYAYTTLFIPTHKIDFIGVVA